MTVDYGKWINLPIEELSVLYLLNILDDFRQERHTLSTLDFAEDVTDRLDELECHINEIVEELDRRGFDVPPSFAEPLTV